MNKETYSPKQGETPNAETVIQLTKDDLPLHCPLDRMPTMGLSSTRLFAVGS